MVTILRKSPQLARLMLATRSDTSVVSLVAVVRSLPIQKSTITLPGSKGMQEVTTYSYKGRDLVRLHGGTTRLASNDFRGATSQNATAIMPVSFARTVAANLEEDPFVNTDELGDAIAQLEAMEFEIEMLDAEEEAAFSEWEGWYEGTLVVNDLNRSRTMIHPVAAVPCSNMKSISSNASNMAESCFDQHYAKALEVAGAHLAIRTAINGARTAFKDAWNAAGPGNQAVIVATVRTSAMFGWIGLGVITVGVVGYGVYLAYNCYSRSRGQAGWSPTDQRGSTVHLAAERSLIFRTSNEWRIFQT